MDSPPQPATPHVSAAPPAIRPDTLIVIGLSVAVVLFFFAWVPRYGPVRGSSALAWLYSAWNGETDYEHGLIFPFLITGLIIYRFQSLRSAVGKGSWLGLAVVLLGALFYAAAYRTLQARVAVGALPIILWGSALYLWGWQVAKLLAFPLFFFWLAIPLPGFQQATTGLQHLAAQLAHLGSGLCGVETIVKGTDILPVKGDWQPLSIAGGCSGIRSLMALLMISATWAYVAKISLWKKALLFLAAVPLAILGNALRVTSIFVIAEYGDARWARETWHDWSGLVLFYPISLFILLCLHTLLEGELPWKRANRKQLQRTVVSARNSTPVQPQP
ncbi:MAG: exosortase/archaeosortase family protein [Akkermansiaceae bacterium]|nr:exosortase/archaeosortase family protein [Akkermansiaceae bacterium]